MGIDYNQDTGVEYNLESFADRFIHHTDNAARLKRVIKAVNAEIKSQHESSDNCTWPNVKITTSDELREFWNTVTAYGGEPGKYEGDMAFTYWSEKEGWKVNDSYDLTILVEAIGNTENLPSVSSVRIFDSYRQHSEMTIGEPVIIYSSDDVWERSLSPAGKKLEKLCGYVCESSWTDVC